jgi:DNA-binding MarR family transcriptional regulator
MDLDEIIRRKFRYGKIKFALHFKFIAEKIKTSGSVTIDDLRKEFGLSRARAFEILDDLVTMDLLYRYEGLYLPVKNNGEIVILKYLDLAEEILLNI